jgi:signal transduction histidine kinase
LADLRLPPVINSRLLAASPAVVAGLVGMAALARSLVFFNPDSGGDSFWILVDLTAGLTLSGWGLLRVVQQPSDGAAYLLQAAGLAWGLAAFCELGSVSSAAWIPFGDATADIQVGAHLLARSLLVAAAILLLPDREADGYLRRGPGEAAVAGLTAALAVGLFTQPAAAVLRGTPFGFGNRTWIEAASEVPGWLTGLVAGAVAVALVALQRQRRGLPPTSFYVISWILVCASIPLAAGPIGDRLGSPTVDLLAVVVFPGLPVVAGIALLRATAALGRTVRRLRATQQAMVEAVEAERRRLRQDLHDGLGPALAGIALGIRAAGSAPDQSKALLDRLATETENCLEEVRRIVYDLRPPALDQLGLAAAVRAHAERLCLGEEAPSPRLAIGELGTLSAATELAVYRIAAEAVTNAVRHSGASEVRVALSRDSRFVNLSVSDDGLGLPASPPPGIGLVSMRQRAEAVGGSLHIGSGPAGGTEVRAILPLAAS